MLVGENGVVKIADFGLARIINEDQYVAKAGSSIRHSLPNVSSLMLLMIFQEQSFPSNGLRQRRLSMESSQSSLTYGLMVSYCTSS